ncbi:hypothetical protein [Maribacter flavus]|uniref:hypothetical protein n=1 Tax=Maribacter flavus TaxID=1658664 RepID=UPI001376090D|nr:hypothetical protein [Maribacter flavus]
MTEAQYRIQHTAMQVHESLRRYYEAWQELEALANKEGMTLDTKTAQLKPLE